LSVIGRPTDVANDSHICFLLVDGKLRECKYYITKSKNSQ
jgi:hypothetical protein